MKHTFLKILCFVVSFIITMRIAGTIMNMGNTDMTEDMAPATFPLVTTVVSGEDVNLLHGYSGEMEANYLRDTLTPLPEDRKLYLNVTLFGTKVEGVSYEVRSLDTSRLIEQTEVYDYIVNGDKMVVDLEIKDLIEKEQEYMLIPILRLSGGKTVKYYTRIVWQDELHVQEKLDYVHKFHEKTLDKSTARSLAAYLESNEEGDNSSYAHVNIHSSLKQVTWGGLDILDIEDMQTQILEMDESTASIRLDYVMRVSGETEIENYLVNEFFRVRYTKDRMYLLDYERTMNQLFDPNANVFVNDKIILGITAEDNELKENSDGSVIVFEQAGALYAYRNGEDKIARLFCFYDEDNMDLRTLYQDHEIHILQVDEAGNILFSVSGYMNRGKYEGQVGIAIYYFNTTINAIEERVFIPYNRSFAHLDQDMDILSYVNRRNDWYIFLGESVFRVRLDDATADCIVSNMTRDRIVSSRDGQMIAWSNEDDRYTIHMMDLSNGRETEIQDENGEMVNLVGFIGEDLVYGMQSPHDVVRSSAGVDMKLMHTIVIQNKTGKVLKTYHQNGIYVSSAYIEGNTIQMKRINRVPESGTYYTASDDQIMNNEVPENTRNAVTKVITQDKEKITEITLTSSIKKDTIRLQTPKEVIAESGNILNIVEESESTTPHYYVYAGGGLKSIFNTPAEAVNDAAILSGVVVDDGQGYIWQKGNRKNRTQIGMIDPEAATDSKTPLATCLDVVLAYEGIPRSSSALLAEGETALSILNNDIEGKVLDMTGCDLSSMLYYVSKDTPVLAGVGAAGSILIVGYDEKNTIIMDPKTGTIYKVGMNDSTEWFASCGNEFIAYVRGE